MMSYFIKFLLIISLYIGKILGIIEPITITGKHFIKSKTKEPFFIKGVDYQPGGSSAVNYENDPLSDPEVCARDIILFQQLGINTIRVYSISTDLNHDACMTMLALAGIYLFLDVNSPLPFHHLNRHEPWTSYNDEYLTNIFKVIEQFSHYENTLGFFIGNEIISDKISSKNSPVYVKSLIRDTKHYIKKNSPRVIPVGYSAIDDLSYRIPLSKYLECQELDSLDSIDFYGINSYQWCGEQTFYTSGYNILVENFNDYTKPVFFSEYGCNLVSPREFDEIQKIYSTDMLEVFSGGLVYEFTQEENNYGLVKINSDGNVQLLDDFFHLLKQFNSLSEISIHLVVESIKKNSINTQDIFNQKKHTIPECKKNYLNIEVNNNQPIANLEASLGKKVDVVPGKFLNYTKNHLTSNKKYFTPKGELYDTEPKIKTLNNDRKIENKSQNSVSVKRNGMFLYK